MIYAVSDLHGEYEKYVALLATIHFCENDTLYVLGDIVDRGPDPIRILQDMASRPNIYPLMGNHEFMALDLLRHLMVEITAENYQTHMDEARMTSLLEWQLNGGSTTLAGFQKLSLPERFDLLDYVSDFPLYDAVDLGDRTFLLVHAGLGGFQKNKPLRSYTPQELLFSRPDYDRQYFDDPSIYIVSGHTPTLAITGKAEIYHSCHNILIDCGASYEKGRLACLCLDTLEEYYI